MAKPCSARRRAEQQDVGALSEPLVSGCQRHHLRLGDHRDAVEVEGGQRLAGRQPRFGQMPLHAAATSIGHLVLGEGGFLREPHG